MKCPQTDELIQITPQIIDQCHPLCKDMMQDHKQGFSKPIQGCKQPGFSHVYRNVLSIDKLPTTPEQGVTSLKQLYLDVFQKRYADRKFLGRIDVQVAEEEGKQVQKRSIKDVLTYKEGYDIGARLASALHRKGLLHQEAEHNMRLLGIYSRNRMEFYLADIACVIYGITSVPLYDTLGKEALPYCLEHSQITTCICSTPNAKNLLGLPHCGNLKNIILCDNVPAQLEAELKQCFNIYYFWQLIEEQKGEEAVNHQDFEVGPDQCFTFCYTSGTTGFPKCSMNTQSNFLSFLAGYKTSYKDWGRDTEEEVHLSILPLPHVFERCIICAEIYNGSFIVATSGNILKIKEDIALARPTQLIAVPRLLNRFVEGLFAAFGGQENLEKLIQADSPILGKVREGFGGRIKFLLVGSAPMSGHYLSILKGVFKCSLVEGYGQTENTAAAFLQNLSTSEYGNLGYVCPNLEFKLMDLPDMNYTSDDKDEHGNPTPRGEVWLRGRAITLGYYKDPEKTAEAITKDGWLQTGDVGMLNAKTNTLRLIDRKKNIFKLSQGEYVSPEKVEICYVKSKYANQVFLHGDSTKDYPIAVAVANPPQIEALGKQLGIDKDLAGLCEDKQILRHVLQDFQAQGKEKGFASFEQAKNLRLESQPFATKPIVGSTLKLQRFQARKFFEKVLEEMYAEGTIL